MGYQNLCKGSKRLIKDLNRAIVVNFIRENGPVSRAAIAAYTNLTQPTLTAIINVLLNTGIIHKNGKGESSGGRCPALFEFNSQYGFIAGIKIEIDRVLLGLIDLGGKLLTRHEEAFPRGSTGKQVLKVLKRGLEQLPNPGRLLGIGIGVSGFIDMDRGVVIFSPVLNWRNVPIAAPLEKLYKVPVLLDNDVNSLTLAEHWYGAGRPYQNFVCVTVGTGIGSGVVIDNKLYRGSAGGAGEIGHMMIDPDGHLCACGERGCLEAVTADSFLVRTAQDKGIAHSIEDLLTAATNGDRCAQDIFVMMGENLGIGVKNIINLLNPQAIILGGERMNASPFFLPAFTDMVRHHSFPDVARELIITEAQLGEAGFLIGAGTLVTQAIFEPPLYTGRKPGRNIIYATT
ncbi:ROK family protein [Candidatus Acetothermia bacterium]|jgi:predicted NBD/HSP70 family sugar kinase|nr:ROK family protein [Candidatus Acetothermia bacterium]MCI2426145.1 ROK family protein [Candidatus Acetothermia bacterium]MCI2427518.1 ROK family protein [Candidatus Acetothermia bacterium]MCI2427990.1 ROK family protein [Candidatus Acetothermia bacterium]